MSETLIAVLLVTLSAKGSTLVYRWPPSPESSLRLARPRLNHDIICMHGDNPWRAANGSENSPDKTRTCPDSAACERDGYLWQRPRAFRHRSSSVSQSRSHPASRRASPTPDMTASFSNGNPGLPRDDEYDNVLGYSAEFLAGLLCPQSSMCHQKFEFIVDNLAFIGHPVCAEPDGSWRFKPDRAKLMPRGRVSKKGETPRTVEKSLTPDRTGRNKRPLPDASWLQTFHLVLVLDRPDPSSSTSGTVWKYLDTIYEHITFTVTAVLYQEQVLHNFVEDECDLLGSLREEYSKKGEPFADYISAALQKSNIAAAMKTIYESIKERTIARITIHELPLELQLPPYLDSLLHAQEESEADIYDRDGEDGLPNPWGSMAIGRKLPSLKPWRSLLRLDDEDERGYELYMRLKAPQLTAEDRELAEQLIRFLDIANITLSLADMASLLDWDLESQLYPTVRWLVRHRRAKVVDIVHPGLRTVFTVPQKLSARLSDLSADFDGKFAADGVPRLPKILSMISMSTHQQGANHFYGTVVKSKEHISLYHEVVIWMLKRDLLITLHLRIRIVATEELKHRVRTKYEMVRAKRERMQAHMKNEDGYKESTSHDSHKTEASKEAPSLEIASQSSPDTNWFSLSPKTARQHARQQSAGGHSQASARTHLEAEKHVEDDFEEDLGSSGAEDVEDWYRGHGDDNNPYSSMISDPARASRLERRWLAGMSEGKDPYIAGRFEKINQYFDGKCTDDEILFLAEISRKQLREVLHHYDEYVQTFLHPS